MRKQPAWIAMLAGISATLIVFALLVTVAVLIALWIQQGAIVASTARLLLVWSVASAILAFAGGGWLAARLAKADQEGMASLLGAMTSLGALLVVVGGVGEALGEQMDIHGLAVALGYVEPMPASEALPFTIATPPPSARPTVDQSSIAQTRTIATISYGGIVALSLIAAGALGGWWFSTERQA